MSFLYTMFEEKKTKFLPNWTLREKKFLQNICLLDYKFYKLSVKVKLVFYYLLNWSKGKIGNLSKFSKGWEIVLK